MKRAVLDVSLDLLSAAEAAGFSVMIDALAVAGVEIAGSAQAPMDGPPIVRFIVEGDGLPDQCADGWAVIRPVFEKQTHGGQSIVRVLRIDVTGRPALTLAA